MQGSWRVTPVGALQDKTSRLARQLARSLNSWLVPVVSCCRQNALFDENWLFAFLTHSTINTLIPMKCRKLLERTLKEKPLRKTRLTYSQSSSFDSPNSSTLTISIDTSLKGTLAKSLSHHTHVCEEAFWYLGSSLEETNSFWLMQWVIMGSGKLKKTRFGVTLLKQEVWKA